MKNNFQSANKPSEFLELWLASSLLSSPNQKIFERYYRNYIKNFNHNLKDNYDNRLADILRIIKKRKGKAKILDIGSGCGSEALFFSTLGCEVLGIDLDEQRTNAARERKKILEKSLKKKLNCAFNVGSVFNLDSRKFDIIWMMESFHHIEPREKFISLLPQLLEDGGHLIISESNASNPLIQLLMFKTRGFSTKKTKKDADGTIHRYGRERIIRAKTLVKILEKNGICHEYTRYFRMFALTNCWLDKIGMNESCLLRPFFVHYNYVGFKKKN